MNYSTVGVDMDGKTKGELKAKTQARDAALLCPARCGNPVQVDTQSNETFGLHETHGFMYCSSCRQSWPIWMCLKPVRVRVPKQKTFRTSDGYTLQLINGAWTDNDLAFEDRNGWPIDCFGEPLEGAFQ